MWHEGETAVVANTRETATKLIRAAILDGRLAPGARLKEVELARNLAISRTPIREALRMLSVEGLVSVVPNKGAFVATRTPAELRDIYDLRALVEGYGARRAAETATPGLIEELDASVDRWAALREASAAPLEFIRENQVFHTKILASVGSERLSATSRSLAEVPFSYEAHMCSAPPQLQRAEDWHRHLVDALRSGAGDRAETIMRLHILEGRDVILAHFDEHGHAELDTAPAANGRASASRRRRTRASAA